MTLVPYGDTVKLAELGSFRLDCKKDRAITISYRPSKTIKNELDTDFRGDYINGQNADLTLEEYAELWLQDHPDDVVIMMDGRPYESQNGDG